MGWPVPRAGQAVVRMTATTICGTDVHLYCLNGALSQCGGPLGGWRFGNTINGAWAELRKTPQRWDR